MPSYVDNELKVTGLKKHISEFVDFVKSDFSCFDFRNIIPYPKDLLVNPEDLLVKDNLSREREVGFKMELTLFRLKHPDQSYEKCYKEVRQDVLQREEKDWCIANWGTTWNAGKASQVTSVSGKLVCYQFVTAWTEPCPVILEAGKIFPKLKFSLHFWEEPGVDIKGSYVVKNGKEMLYSMERYNSRARIG